MNRIQYNKELKKILNTIDTNNKPLLFLHMCCAPCSSYVINYLKDYFIIIGIYSNSNIDSYNEFIKRENEILKLKNILKSPSEIIELSYNHNEFLECIKGLEQDIEFGERCKTCIKYRLKKSIEYAIKRINNDLNYYNDIWFTTTLTTSTHKDALYINNIIIELLLNTNIKALLSDFKKDNGNLLSIQLSKKYNLYRQEYCGCEFSKRIN
ncbi:MAG: epoxyqueuosine reductase QueH [Eubacteriales bacterium]|nr:epoxyqueuosine reductase QueH [Eubacteriales bacterium]